MWVSINGGTPVIILSRLGFSLPNHPANLGYPHDCGNSNGILCESAYHSVTFVCDPTYKPPRLEDRLVMIRFTSPIQGLPCLLAPEKGAILTGMSMESRVLKGIYVGFHQCGYTKMVFFRLWLWCCGTRVKSTPKWMVYSGKSPLKWMIWGYPYDIGNLHIWFAKVIRPVASWILTALRQNYWVMLGARRHTFVEPQFLHPLGHSQDTQTTSEQWWSDSDRDSEAGD